MWLAAMAGLLACPLTYKGGAELPHAHALFQLIYDAAHGSIDHHHDGDAVDDDEAPAALVAAPPLSSLGASTGPHLAPMTESAAGLSLALTFPLRWTGIAGRGHASPDDALVRDGQHPAPEPPPPRHLRH
ncbi:MAG TPA: hypothetical protein VFQ80_12795 [Thermomicrobiales bacterium]|jgi:hypothetical protein|nr:hypothetical protein [Thermomicrobiales bacterium]